MLWRVPGLDACAGGSYLAAGAQYTTRVPEVRAKSALSRPW